jgi:SAM-dependent methyltransferase
LPVLERLILPHVRPRGHILDLCCGTGQLAADLTARGYTVTGVDGSAEILNYARARAPGVEFIHADVRSFSVPPQFDAAVSLYDSLNHLMQVADLRATFANVRAALKRGGQFLCDFNMQAGFEGRWRGSVGLAADDHALVYRPSFDAASRVGRAAVTMFRLEHSAWRRTDLTLHQRCYTEEEITGALRAAGFTELATFDAPRDLGMQAEVGRSFFFSRAR